jgi:flagella basal body P-ring formation protein FlgA
MFTRTPIHCSNHKAFRGSTTLRLLHSGVMAYFVALTCIGAHAQGMPGDINQFARQWLEQNMPDVNETGQSMPLRPEVVLGSLDPRLQLAPCGRVEAYLPKGTQLWGPSRIGLKCMEGPVAWNVFLPVTVKAWGPAWVLRRPVQGGTILKKDDAELVAEVDWAESRASVLPSTDQWVGMQAAYALLPGQALRQNLVRPPQVFGSGSQVRVVTSGTGFQISATAQAMSAGYVGQAARVKLSNGKVVSGSVSPEGSVHIPI